MTNRRDGNKLKDFAASMSGLDRRDYKERRVRTIKIDDPIRVYAFVNHLGELQGIGDGGYEFTAQSMDSVKMWPEQEKSRAEGYLKIINYGDKGYRLVMLRIEDADPSNVDKLPD